jgi:hypothetical protein
MLPDIQLEKIGGAGLSDRSVGLHASGFVVKDNLRPPAV